MDVLPSVLGCQVSRQTGTRALCHLYEGGDGAIHAAPVEGTNFAVNSQQIDLRNNYNTSTFWGFPNTIPDIDE